MAEVDGTGVAISYLLLSTAQTIEPGKRHSALSSWMGALKVHHGICPRVIHTDKDLAELAAAQDTWSDSYVNLCYWHCRRESGSHLPYPLAVC